MVAKSFKELAIQISNISNIEEWNQVQADISWSYQHGGRDGNGKIKYSEHEILMDLVGAIGRGYGWCV